jgi:hypothetical protein
MTGLIRQNVTSCTQSYNSRLSFSNSSSSLAYGPYSLTIQSLRMIAHTNLPSAFFLHLLTPADFRQFSVQSSTLNFGLPTFLLLATFPRNTLFTVLSSDVFTR